MRKEEDSALKRRKQTLERRRKRRNQRERTKSTSPPGKDKQAGVLPFSEGAVPKIIRMRWWTPSPECPHQKAKSGCKWWRRGREWRRRRRSRGTHVCSSTQAKPFEDKNGNATLATGLEEIRTQYDLFWRRSDDHQQKQLRVAYCRNAERHFRPGERKKTFTWKSSIRQSHGSHARNFKVWRMRNDWMFQDPPVDQEIKSQIRGKALRHLAMLDAEIVSCTISNRTLTAVLRTTRLSIEWFLCIIQRKWLRWFRWWSKVGSAWPSVPDKSIRLDTIVVLNAQPVWQNSWWEPSPNSWDLTDYHDSGWKRDAQWASLSKVKATPRILSTQKKRWTKGDERRRPQRRVPLCDHIFRETQCERKMRQRSHMLRSLGKLNAIYLITKGKWGQSSSNSSWEPRVREDTVTGPTAHRDPGHTRPTCQGDPSIEFQTLSEKIKIWKVTSSRTCTHSQFGKLFFKIEIIFSWWGNLEHVHERLYVGCLLPEWRRWKFQEISG